jgi:NHLM bacteriocin system ABC transporter peptidase/ATP-binding protein
VSLTNETKKSNSPFHWPKRKVRTPTVLQMEAVECGAAALGMILAYYRRWVPLEKLRVDCGVSRDGVNALNMVKVGRSYGLEVSGNKRDVDELGDLKLPFIVFWNYNHFLVVEGFSSTHAFLNDPAAGRRSVTRDDFERQYSGAAITFKKGPEFKPGGKPKSTARALFSRMKGTGVGLLFVLFASLILVVPGLVIPAFMRIFMDDILNQGRKDWILWLLLSMFGVSLINGAMTWVKEYYLLRLETRLALSTSGKFFWHVLHLPLEFFDQRFGGEIASRVALNDSLASLIGGKLAEALLNVLMIGFYGAVMWYYDRVLTIIGIGLAAINFIVLSALARWRVDANLRLVQEKGRVSGQTMGGLGMMDTLKATGRESDFFVRWAGQETKMLNVQQEVSSTSQVLSVIPGFVSSLSTIAILCVGGLRVMNGEMSLGMLLAFQSLMGSFIDPVNSMVGYGTQLQQAAGDLNRLEDVLMNPMIDLPFDDLTGPTGKLTGQVELRNVTFGYSKLDPPLLEDFSLVMQPGQRIALVGATGSGKSTVGKIVTGLLTPWSGEILFDGKPRAQIPRTVIASSVSHVDQEIMLFPGTIRANLTLWDEEIDDDAVIRAAKDACIYDLIMSRTSELDSIIDEAGRNFSGGERQRLEIARALVSNPTIVVLDEATSALDPLVEKQIDSRLRARGCSCFIIAHRLSTIRDADEIIVLQKGHVVQRGTHEALIATGGPYKEMVDAEVSQPVSA